MPKYGRFQYDTGVYGNNFVTSDYIHNPELSISSKWDVELRSTYGVCQETGARAAYGDHIRYGGVVKVPYKFIPTTDYFSDLH